MDYKIIINTDENSGLWVAHKQYENGDKGVPFMFAETPECLKYKLEEDGEDSENIYQETGLQ
jgi:hypothetical protein